MNLIKRLKENEETIISNLEIIKRQNAEILWAATWNNTKNGIEWIKELPSVSPGRWAVGYNYLYVMTRILNEVKPHHVLEFGLGVSSILISKYFDYYSIADGEHTIVENDNDWVDFYIKNKNLSSNSRIALCKCVKRTLQGESYCAYDTLSNVISGKKYDVISIDGPRGGAGSASRRDILEFIPEILKDNFIIIIDDASRIGERKTIEDLKVLLEKSHRQFCIGSYVGESDVCIITSPNYKWLCTM